jgi:hypothetical protein
MADHGRNGRFLPGNRVNQRHGVDGFRSLGRLPRGCRSIRGDLLALRRSLEGETRQLHGIADGPLPARYAAAVNSAVGHEGVRRLWLRWIDRAGETAPPETFARAMAEVRQAAEQRDRLIDRLLADRPVDDFAGLLGRTAAGADPFAGERAEVAPDAGIELPAGWGAEVSDR